MAKEKTGVILRIYVYSDYENGKHTEWGNVFAPWVKDTGGIQAGRSAALQSAEQNAHRIDDEYARISAYEIRDDDNLEEDRDPREIEREKYGDGKDNLDLFGAPASLPATPPVLQPVPLVEDIGLTICFTALIAGVIAAAAPLPSDPPLA